MKLERIINTKIKTKHILTLINNYKQIKQVVDFTGIQNGLIHPTDIDAVLEFDNDVLIIIELKYFNLPISSDNINLQKQNENFFVNGNLKTPSSEINNKLINKYYENNNLKNLILSSNSEFSFNINKKLLII